VIHVARRLWQNLRADRRRPPHARLAALEDPERFVWEILPYAARSFSFCIALLPRRTARPLAVAYLYCRMLDTCEDLPAAPDEKERKLAAFLARFESRDGPDAPPGPAPTIDAARARDAADRTYLLLLERAERVDRFFVALPADQRAAILRLVRRMGEGMIWAVRAFAAQGGALESDEQLSKYCFGVLGNPILFAEEMQRLDRGLAPELPPERVALDARVGEAIQLANVARDLEKDCAAGVWYLPELKRASPAELPSAIAAARRRLLARALALGRAFEPCLRGIPSPSVSLARGAALLMALFTLSFWQRTAERLGLELVPRRDRVTPARSVALVARAVFSRRGSDAVLARLDRVFDEAARRLAEQP
jgi:phytoene/squalene synthetase